MLKTRFLEGPLAPLFFLSVGALGAAANAQEVSREDLKRCAAMSSDAGKLACFESLAARYADDPSAETASTEVQPVSITAQPAQADRPPAPPESIAAGPAASAPIAVDSKPAPAPPAAADTDSDFGREEQRSKPEALSATVSEVSADRLRRLVFEFENGQVWRQQEPRHFPYPRDEPFDVVISRGLLGDYQLRVGGEGRMTRVRRLK